MVKEKEGCSGCRIVEHRHSFSPFSEIVNRYDDIFVVTSRWWSTFHKVDDPFTKRTSCDDRVERRGRSSRLGGEMLAIGTVFDYFNAITEEEGQKYPARMIFWAVVRPERWPPQALL